MPSPPQQGTDLSKDPVFINRPENGPVIPSFQTETSCARVRRPPVRRNGDYHRLRNGKVVNSGPLGADRCGKARPLPPAAPPTGPSWAETSSAGEEDGGAGRRGTQRHDAHCAPSLRLLSLVPERVPGSTSRHTNVPAKCRLRNIYTPGRSFVALSTPGFHGSEHQSCVTSPVVPRCPPPPAFIRQKRLGLWNVEPIQTNPTRLIAGGRLARRATELYGLLSFRAAGGESICRRLRAHNGLQRRVKGCSPAAEAGSAADIQQGRRR